MHHKLDRGLFWTIIVLFVAYVGINGARVSFDIDFIPWSMLVILFGTIGYLHATHLLGVKRASVMFGITTVIAFAAEAWGIQAGILFGRYAYTDLFGAKVLDVPLIMPFAYFMTAYPCYLMANLLAEGKFVPRHRGFLWMLWLSLLGGMMMTAWDLTIDPLMSCNPANPQTAHWCEASTPAWMWFDGGPYFGVPMQNFVGWMITTTAVFFAYRVIEPRIPASPIVRPYSPFLLLPVVAYGVLSISDAYTGVFEPVRILAPFVMGIAVVATIMRVLGPDGGQRTMES